MLDDERYQSLIETKCKLCFRKDSLEDACMLFTDRHTGIELCLGPFKDQEDRMKKVREDFEKERKRKVDMNRAMRETRINSDLHTYLRKKQLLDDWDSKRKSGD